jgi:DNA polymerase III subunit gamma/tau
VSYQVFARKYRPRTFADVLGQEHVVRTLRNAIAQNRLAHAYLFVGPRGTGKTSTARIFAKALNCPEGPKIDFDPDDPVCVEIAEGRSLDVLEIDGASNNGVDQVRDLRESVKYAPSRCRFKIYYIDEVHMLSTAAFNALLKTLEEPPPHVKFIFATTEANKILPTIISRCQRFDLRRIPLGIIADHLLHIASLEGVDLDPKAAYAIGKGADGGMRDAQSMLDQLVAFCGNTIREQDVLEIFGFTAAQTVSRMARHILDSDTVGALRLVHETSEAGKDLGRLLTELIQHFRTLLVSQADPEAAAGDLEPEVAEQVAEQSQMASTEALLRIVDGLAEVDARMRWATNKRLHLELGVIQAVQHLNEVSLSDVIAALDGDAPVPAAVRPPVRAAAPARPAPAPQPAPRAAEAVAVAPPPQSAPVAVEESVAAPAVEPMPVAPAPEPPPVTEPPPAPAVTTPRAEPPVPAAASALTHEEFRLELIERVRAKRPLIVQWLECTTVLGRARGVVKLGFPSEESHARDSLARDNQRSFLEALASEILGEPMRFDLVVDPSLKPPPALELFGSLPEPARAAPMPAAKPAPVPAEEPSSATAPEPAPAEEASPAAADDFHNDPLIRSAIEKFKLKLAGN